MTNVNIFFKSSNVENTLTEALNVRIECLFPSCTFIGTIAELRCHFKVHTNDSNFSPKIDSPTVNENRNPRRNKSIKSDTSESGKSPILSASKRHLKCKYCFFTTTFTGALTNHVKSCNKEAKSVEDKKNVGKNGNNKSYTCFYCKYKTVVKGELISHYIRRHPKTAEKKHKCTMCPFEAKLMSSIRKHFISKHKNKKNIECFKCKFCDYKTDKSLSLRGHVNASHGKQRSFKMSASKNKHFICESCNYKTNAIRNFKRHMNRIHNKKSNRSNPFLGVSKKGVKQSKKASLILKKRSRVDNFRCPHKGCNYAGMNGKKHLLGHTVKGRFKCSLCSFSCKSRSYLLRVHRMNSHGNQLPKKEAKKPTVSHQISSKKLTKCPHCSYRCVLPSALKRHNTFWHADDNDIISKKVKLFSSKTLQKNKFDGKNEKRKSNNLEKSEIKSMNSIPVINLKRLQKANKSTDMTDDVGASSNLSELEKMSDITNEVSEKNEETSYQNAVWIKSEPIDISNETIE